MKLHRSLLCTLAAALTGLSAAQLANAQLPVSRTQGMIDIPLPPSAVTHVGLPFTRIPVGRFVIASITGTVVNLTGASLPPATLTSHSATIVGGVNDGLSLRITTNAAAAITLAAALPAGTVAGADEIIITPDWTLGSLLGTTVATLQIPTAGATPAAADQVTVEENGVLTSYYFNSTSPEGWRRADGTQPTVDQANVRISGTRGIIVTRGAGSLESFVHHGVVRSGTQRAITEPGKSAILSNPFASSTTLATSGLAAAVRPSTTLANADQVVLDNGTATPDAYILTPGGWRLATALAGADQGSVTLAAGKSVRIVRAGGTPTYPPGWRPGAPKRWFAPVVSFPSLTWRAQERFVP
jgi:hypothetical protein